VIYSFFVSISEQT